MSVTQLIFHFVRRGLLQRGGVTLATLGAGFVLFTPLSLLSPLWSSWAMATRRNYSGIGLLFLIILASLTVNVAGPASAILMIPTHVVGSLYLSRLI